MTPVVDLAVKTWGRGELLTLLQRQKEEGGELEWWTLLQSKCHIIGLKRIDHVHLPMHLFP